MNKNEDMVDQVIEKNLIGFSIQGLLIDEITPKCTIDGVFRADNLGLTSLYGCPLVVNGDFTCSHNEIISLKYAPRHVGRDFLCGINKLTSLEYSPRRINGAFSCCHNSLTTLSGSPDFVKGHFNCASNLLTEIDVPPSYMGGAFLCQDNNLTSLKGVHKKIKKLGNGTFYAANNPIKSHVLGVMLIDGITGVGLDNKEVESILNDGIRNKKHWTEVQAELEEAGFEEYAQL